jgi:hypothetical protein
MPYAAQVTFAKGDPITGPEHEERPGAEAEVEQFRAAIRGGSPVESVAWYAGHSREIRSVQVVETGVFVV